MRSLWRRLALEWLGGVGSQALTGDAFLLDSLMGFDGEREAPIYRIARQSADLPHATRPADGGKSAVPEKVG